MFFFLVEEQDTEFISIREGEDVSVSLTSGSDFVSPEYTVLMGEDSDRFTLSLDGVLTFVEDPNYENPVDSDGDNVYHVEVKVVSVITSTSMIFPIEITITDRNSFLY